jgi:carbon monoxide dehydrogenase subunit G
VTLAAHYTIDAPPERVFEALTNPAILQRCIPGCEELVLDPSASLVAGPSTGLGAGARVFRARVKIGVAGMKGTYTGRAELRDLTPPHSFTLVVDGKGAPGFVHATAAITCAASGTGTHVSCDADVRVGGLIAAVGSRLVEAAARQQMDVFFKNVGALDL